MSFIVVDKETKMLISHNVTHHLPVVDDDADVAIIEWNEPLDLDLSKYVYFYKQGAILSEPRPTNND